MADAVPAAARVGQSQPVVSAVYCFGLGGERRRGVKMNNDDDMRKALKNKRPQNEYKWQL